MARKSATATRQAVDAAQARLNSVTTVDDEFADEITAEDSPTQTVGGPAEEPTPAAVPNVALENEARASGRSTEKVEGTRTSARRQVRRETALETLDDAAPYGTGIEIPEELYDKVMKASSTRARQVGDVRQTEVWLTAFETVYEELAALVQEHKQRHLKASPLFGRREVRVAESNSPMKRLQIRPRAGEYRAVQKLADKHEVSLAVLTRLVLKRYFEVTGKRRGGRRARPDAAETTDL